MASLQNYSFGAFVVEAAFLGETVAFALGDGSVRLVGGVANKRIDVHAGAILTASPDRDGKKLITGGDDGRVACIGADGEVAVVADLARKWIDHVAAGPNNTIAYASGRQVFVRFGDGRERLLDLARAAGGLAFAPKGLRLAVARYDGVDLWWIGTEAEPVSFEWKGAHLGVWFSPDGRYVITTMQENTLHGWRLSDAQDLRMSGYPAKVRSLAWSAKGRFLATSGANAAILWPFHTKDGPMGKEPAQLGERDALVTRIACHPRKEILAVGYQDGMVSLVGIEDRSVVVLRPPAGSSISALAFDRRGDRLCFGSEDGGAGVIGTGA